MLKDLDISILHFFNGDCRNKALDYAVPFITEIGNGVFIFILALVMMFFGNKRVKASGILLLAGSTFAYNIANVLKHLVARPRPFITLSEVKALYITEGFSFPSTHAAMAFVTAVILAKCFGWRAVFYFIALLVAISRVYLGIHYPSDVIVGGLIGIVAGYVLIRMAESAGVYTERHEGVR